MQLEVDFSLCLSCGYTEICATLSGGEPVAYECDAYSPSEELWKQEAGKRGVSKTVSLRQS